MISRLIGVLAQPQCMVCGLPGAAVCAGCAELVFTPRRPSCFACNTLSSQGRTCRHCRARHDLHGVIAPYRLEATLQDLIHRYKYEHDRDLARVFARQLAPHVSGHFDTISFVPADGRRLRERGFNQAQLLARELGRFLGQPACATLLRRHHVPQVGKGRSARFEQVRDNFIAVKNLAGQHVLIVDDVLTTGATLDECARTLRASGAKQVWGVVVARK